MVGTGIVKKINVRQMIQGNITWKFRFSNFGNLSPGIPVASHAIDVSKSDHDCDVSDAETQKTCISKY
jgi:hypothetical protein